MTLDEMIAAAARQYQFRRQLKKESAAAYRHALIAHVESHDFAMAHELRLGKPQPEWTVEEVIAFKHRILELPRTRQDHEWLMPAGTPVIATPPGTEDVTEAHLRELAEFGLQDIIGRRRRNPTWEVPIVVSVLLMTGSSLITTTQRGDRFALLKFLARNGPVFGFFLVADMFLHKIGDTKAEKQEGIILHVGTRDMRLVRVATYARTPTGIVFAAPFDMDMRSGNVIDDPYADIFVSVPPPTGAPS
jgi:hypothetical protein